MNLFFKKVFLKQVSFNSGNKTRKNYIDYIECLIMAVSYFGHYQMFIIFDYYD